jgi:hypothetical protein
VGGSGRTGSREVGESGGGQEAGLGLDIHPILLINEAPRRFEETTGRQTVVC